MIARSRSDLSRSVATASNTPANRLAGWSHIGAPCSQKVSRSAECHENTLNRRSLAAFTVASPLPNRSTPAWGLRRLSRESLDDTNLPKVDGPYGDDCHGVK